MHYRYTHLLAKHINLLLLLALISTACKGQKKENMCTFKVQKTESEWKDTLDETTYYIMREKSTEPAFSGKHNKFYEDGKYHCAACGVLLYESEYKFDSGSGWPSFDRGVEKNIIQKKDTSFSMIRTELICSNCGGHLGHIFNDGPQETTGMRHCVNSASLKFIANE